jgi:DNA-directed RNA polymerase subunit beta
MINTYLDHFKVEDWSPILNNYIKYIVDSLEKNKEIKGLNRNTLNKLKNTEVLEFKKTAETTEDNATRCGLYDIRIKVEDKILEETDIQILYPDEEGYFKHRNRKLYSPWVIFDGYEIEDENEKKENYIPMDLNNKLIIPGYYLGILSTIIGILTEKKGIEKEKQEKRFKIINKLAGKIGVWIYRYYKVSNKKDMFKKIPLFFIPDELNYIEYYSNPKKVVYSNEKVNENLRKPHESHRGILDFLETPESQKIGLTLSLVDSKNLVYDIEKFQFYNNSEKEKAEDILSFASYQIPFILHSDGARILMGSKNLKQAIALDKAEKPYIKTGKEINNIGVNAFVGYGLFEGFNFEDGIVISDSFAEKMKTKVEEEEKIRINVSRIKIPKKDKQKWIYGYTEITWKVKEGDFVEYGDTILEINGEHYNKKKKIKYKGRYKAQIKKLPKDLERPFVSDKTDDKGNSIPEIEIIITYIVEKPLEIGDKIMGRHGNKGTVSRILKEEDMPKVIVNGEEKPLEMLLSPLGVVSRMNIGQLYEVHASMAQEFSDFKDFENGISPFENGYNKKDEILDSLQKIGSDEYGRFEVKYQDKKWDLTIGFQYMVRLDHCIRDKIHFTHKATEGNINKQPLKGKSNNGGQKIGEMEFWSLFSYNNTRLIEMFANKNIDKNELSKEEKNLPTEFFYDLMGNFGYEIDTSDYMVSKFEEKKDMKKIEDQDIKEFLAQKLSSKEEALEKSEFLHDIFMKNNFFNKEKTKIENKDKRLLNKTKNLLFKKEGYIRSHMVARRIHNSGRTVITPQPKDNMNYYLDQDIPLDINTTILPIEFGLEMIKNHKDIKLNVKGIKRALKGDYKKRIEVAKELNKIYHDGELKNKYVILNRQPSLHRHSVQSFRPLFWQNYTIALPINICEGLGADFDGDTMAAYYPYEQNEEIIKELEKMLPTNNPFKLGDGSLNYSIDQDMVFGYYTKTKKNKKDMKKEYQNKLKDLVESNKNDEISDLINDEIINGYLLNSMENNLTLSIYEIEKNEEENSMKYIKESGCRGKPTQFNQLYSKIEGITDDCFLRGINIKDYYRAEKDTDGVASRARRTLMDKKLHVADAGYFTRKLVEFMGNIYVGDFDEYKEIILTNKSIKKQGEDSDSKFDISEFINRYCIYEGKKALITNDNLGNLQKHFEKEDKITILSPKIIYNEDNKKFTVSQKYLGKDISTLKEFEAGEYIGLSAGHVLGERGTQLSMQTFHAGDKGLNMITISSGIFKAAFEEKTFEEFITKIEKIGGFDVLKNIKLNPIYFEMLYSLAQKLKELKIDSANKYFSDFDLRGPLTVMSYESGLNIFKDLELDKEYIERHPRATYSFYNEVRNDG